MPLWDYTGVLSKVGFGDVLKFAVYRKEPERWLVDVAMGREADVGLF